MADGIQRDNFRSYFNEFYLRKKSWVFRKAIEETQDEYYMFESGGRPSGFAIIRKYKGDVGEIYAMYFHPKFWGKNCVGKAMEFYLNRLKTLDSSKVLIWVLEKNMQVRKFYEKFGFVLDENEKEIIVGKPLVEL